MKYKSMKILILLMLISFNSCISQSLFEESYFYVQKDITRKFEQRDDSIIITNYKYDKKGVSKSNYSTFYLEIIKDSIINEKSRLIRTEGKKVRKNNSSDVEFNFIITNSENERKRFKVIHNAKTTNPIKESLLYPRFEFKELKPISEISTTEIEALNNEFIDFIKSNYDLKTLDLDDHTIWEKFNDQVAKKGYNPIGAQPLLHNAFTMN